MTSTPSVSTMKTYQALSIRQPWAWLIANGHKDIENRVWSTKFRGKFLIHASKSSSRQDYRDCLNFLEDRQISISLPERKELEYGGIVGSAILQDCVFTHWSDWFVAGGWGFVLKDAAPLPFTPCKGQLHFFPVVLEA